MPAISAAWLVSELRYIFNIDEKLEIVPSELIPPSDIPSEEPKSDASPCVPSCEPKSDAMPNEEYPELIAFTIPDIPFMLEESDELPDNALSIVLVELLFIIHW